MDVIETENLTTQNAEEGQQEANKQVKEKAKKQKRNLKQDTVVDVYCNNVRGNLLYKSLDTNRRFDWQHHGMKRQMELRELQNMPHSYFSNRWVRFDEEDQDVVDYLQISHYYKDAIDDSDVEAFFTMDVDAMDKFLNHIQPIERSAVVEKARQKVKNGSFDSASKIDFIERKYNISLKS